MILSVIGFSFQAISLLVFFYLFGSVSPDKLVVISVYVAHPSQKPIFNQRVYERLQPSFCFIYIWD